MNLHEKWDRASGTYNFITFGEDLRQGDEKRRLFGRARGRSLLVAVGTGNDIKFLPTGLDVVALDISPRMIERARPKAAIYEGDIELQVMDVQQLQFPDANFDTAITACTFCSVPDPLRGLRELYRVLKPGGRLLMFEHVRSDVPMVGLMLDALTYITRRIGPDLNRNTTDNVRRAGFHILREENIYFDIVRAIEASKPDDTAYAAATSSGTIERAL